MPLNSSPVTTSVHALEAKVHATSKTAPHEHTHSHTHKHEHMSSHEAHDETIAHASKAHEGQAHEHKHTHTHSSQLYVDTALLGGVVPSNRAQVQPLIRAGVVGFKCFMIHSGLDEFPHVVVCLITSTLITCTLARSLLTHSHANGARLFL